MFAWCAVLFVLGIAAFVDSMLNMGEVFRTANSILFMLISLGLLVRTTTKIKRRQIEDYEDRIYTLERQVKILEQGREKLADF